MTALVPRPPAAALPLRARGRNRLSVEDAKRLRTRLQQLLGAGQRLDAEIAVVAALVQTQKAYVLLQDEHGADFRDWTSFCVARPPFGLGFNPELVDVLAKEALDPARPARAGVGAASLRTG